MKRDLMEILVCPICKNELVLTVEEEDNCEVVTGSLRCKSCYETYLIENSVPNLLPPTLR